MKTSKIKADVFFNEMKGINNSFYVIMINDLGYLTWFGGAGGYVHIGFSTNISEAIIFSTIKKCKEELDKYADYQEYYDAVNKKPLKKSEVNFNFKKVYCILEDI